MLEQENPFSSSSSIVAILLSTAAAVCPQCCENNTLPSILYSLSKPQHPLCFLRVSLSLLYFYTHKPLVKPAQSTTTSLSPVSAFSSLSFPERTHLLLSGPHVPLVLADLKAPVQRSPCKKSTTAPTPPHCPPHSAGQTVFALSRCVFSACRTRSIGVANRNISYNVASSNAENCTNVPYRYFLLVCSTG